MGAIGFHLVIRLQDDRILTPSVAARRIFASAVAEKGREAGLLFFEAAGTHAHIATACSEKRAGQLAHDLTSALRWRLGLDVAFETHRRTPIRTQRHLENVCRYILDNARKHGTDIDPYHEASNLLDLLGLRVIAAYTWDAVRELLPALRAHHLLRHLGVPRLGEGGDLQGLVESAAAAIGVPRLEGRRPLVVSARVAAARVALELGARPGWLAEHLAISERWLRDLTRKSADEALVLAIRRQLWLRDHLRTGRNP